MNRTPTLWRRFTTLNGLWAALGPMTVMPLRHRMALAGFLILGGLVISACASPPLVPLVMVTRVPMEQGLLQGQAGAQQAVATPRAPATVGGGAPATPVTLGVDRQEPSVEELDIPSTPPVPEASVPEGDGNGSYLAAFTQTRNILLLGTDQNSLEFVGRTDAIMILALDLPNSRASLVSLPRDIYLPIPGVGYSRINTAYAYGEERKVGGGIPLLISTLEKNFHIPIHNYMRIDFGGFREVIDALEGVDIVVDCPFFDEKILAFFGTEVLEPGEYHMTGAQALFYARSRKTTNDFDRSRRQQQVLMAMRDRVLDGNLLPAIPALWRALGDSVDTDLGAAELLDLARLGASIDSRRLYGMVLRPPLVTGWITPQGGQVQLPDLPAISQALEGIWERPPFTTSSQEERICP